MSSIFFNPSKTIKRSLIDDKGIAHLGTVIRESTSNRQGQAFFQNKAAGYRLQEK
jgi:hypothetical protein